MVSLGMPLTLRFGRLIAENVVNTGKYETARCQGHKLMLNKWLGDRRRMSVTSEETRQNAETIANEESENERKLRTENENLTKEIGLLSQQKLEIEVGLAVQGQPTEHTDTSSQTNAVLSTQHKATHLLSTITDKYKRALADGENMRRRLMKQIEDAKVFGIQGFCKDLLEVADILGKATESVPKEEVRESNPHLKNLYEGLKMTEAQLHKVFVRHGLISVNPIEEKFDPNLHEALFQQEVQGKAAGTVVVVSKIGYKLHERVIRPALVGVAKGP